MLFSLLVNKITYEKFNLPLFVFSKCVSEESFRVNAVGFSNLQISKFSIFESRQFSGTVLVSHNLK